MGTGIGLETEEPTAQPGRADRSEYLVIAGLVVAIIIAIMLVFRSQLTIAINNLTGNIVESTTGK